MITRRVCRHRAGCFAVATHGVTEGSTAGVPAFCPAHSEESMVDFRFNSSTKTCVHPGCADRPAYRAPGRRAQYCHLHAEPGMTMKCKRRGNVGFKQADEGQNSAPDTATVQMCTRAGCGKRAFFTATKLEPRAWEGLFVGWATGGTAWLVASTMQVPKGREGWLKAATSLPLSSEAVPTGVFETAL